MENAQLVGLSRQLGLQRQMDVIANNMANLNTIGFKGEQILFEEHEMPEARDLDFAAPDQALQFTYDWATLHDMAPGTLMHTGNDLDVGLEGDGFFVIQTPDGERYTRNGAFQLNQLGELVTSEGYSVLADGGFVTFAPGETNITIGADGAVTSSAGNKGFLRIVEFEDVQALQHEGNAMFSGSEPQAAIGTQVVQGALERSNVSGVAMMTEMIRVNRAYSTLAEVMKNQEELRLNTIRKVTASV